LKFERVEEEYISKEQKILRSGVFDQKFILLNSLFQRKNHFMITLISF